MEVDPGDVVITSGAQHGAAVVLASIARPGDLLLTLRVVLPPADTPEARELYETMARKLAFDARAAAGDGA